MNQAHILIPTHTTRHLDTTLSALSASEKPPRSIIVSVDGDDSEFHSLVASIPYSKGTGVTLVTRPHQGQPRLNQVRNNALRALRDQHDPSPDDAVIIIDGDMALACDAITLHLDAIACGADAVLASRKDLTKEQTEQLAGTIGSHDPTATRRLMDELWQDGYERVAQRQSRILKQRRLRSIPMIGKLLVKAHKPKILGGHHALRWSLFEQLNGYDERFVGYGYDDDDLARRVHAAGARTAVCIDSIKAFHLWHPTRAPARPTDAPGYQTFCQPWSLRVGSGFSEPGDQPEPTVVSVHA